MGNYVEVSDVLAEGVPASTPTPRINRRINKWEALVEKLTGNVFRIVEPGELTFDGNNSRILHFTTPLVEVTALKINGESVELGTAEYRAYTGRGPLMVNDDRHNPKIVLTGATSESIYHTKTHGIFVKGYDQKVTAKWGYVEADDSCPLPVKDAITALVAMDFDGYFDQVSLGSTGPRTPLRREKTDGHEVEFMEAKYQITWSMIPRDIADVLSIYRKPMKIASPEPVYHMLVE